jgi:hypothetical protein
METIQLWEIGCRLFRVEFVRFMLGSRNLDLIVKNV